MALLLLVNTAPIARPAELDNDTLTAWQRYIDKADTNAKAASASDRTFLRIEQIPGQIQRIKSGEVIVSEIKVPNTLKTPEGTIHNWVGAVFIPAVTLEDVLRTARQYDHYPRWYGPTVAQAHLLDRNGEEDRFTTLYVRTVFLVTVAMEIEYSARYSMIDATRGYSVFQSTHIDEIHNYGRPDQSKTPADAGSGYLWRVHSLSKYVQRDNGVYIEQESIVLSQEIPAGYRWLIEPTVNRLAKNLLESSLRQARQAVRSSSPH